MIEMQKRSWRTETVNNILKEYPGAIHLFDSYKNIFCSGSPYTLAQFCEKYFINIDEMEEVLDEMLETSYIKSIGATDWELDFVVDFLINIHHKYVKKQVPILLNKLKKMGEKADESSVKLLLQLFSRVEIDLVKTLNETENGVFPYIKQIARAYKSKESYGELLVSTLRKPIEKQLAMEITMMKEILNAQRMHADYYCLPQSKVAFRSIIVQLKAFDFQLQRHIQLKEEVLLPRSLEIEGALHKS
jgi:regulator of cell morphogenesis and NO signaling